MRITSPESSARGLAAPHLLSLFGRQVLPLHEFSTCHLRRLSLNWSFSYRPARSRSSRSCLKSPLSRSKPTRVSVKAVSPPPSTWAIALLMPAHAMRRYRCCIRAGISLKRISTRPKKRKRPAFWGEPLPQRFSLITTPSSAARTAECRRGGSIPPHRAYRCGTGPGSFPPCHWRG